jgi:hypothetical protein
MEATIMGGLDPHLLLRHRPPCSGKLACDLQAFSMPEFVVPLLLALGGLVLALVLAATTRKSSPVLGRWQIMAGIVLMGAALGGYQLTGHLVTGLLIAITLLGVGGLIADARAVSSALRMALSLPGAAVIAFGSALPDPLWARLFAGAMTVIGTRLIGDVEERTAERGLGPVLLAVTAFGLYESVPDPDFALLLVGAALPTALFGWPVPIARLGGVGAAVGSGFLAWAGAVGGRGLLSAVIAGAACLGLFILDPLAVWFRSPSLLAALPARRWTAPATGAFQLALAAASSRLVLARNPGAAAAVACGGVLGGALLLRWAGRSLGQTMADRRGRVHADEQESTYRGRLHQERSAG